MYNSSIVRLTHISDQLQMPMNKTKVEKMHACVLGLVIA